MPASVATSPIGYLVGFILFGFGGAIIYLYICNRRTRQSLHDLAVGTFVTRATPAGRVAGSIWRPHLIAVGVWFLVVIGLSAAMAHQSRRGEFPGLLKVARGIEATGQVHMAKVSVGRNWRTVDGRLKEKTYLHVNAVGKGPPVDAGAEAQQVAATILRDFPRATDMDVIGVTISYGYDLGIGSAWISRGFRHSPSEWGAVLAKPPSR